MAFDGDSGILRVHVADTGKGITSANLTRLQRKLNRHTWPDKANPDSLGMGLLICQNLVRKSGGALSVYSEGENKGAVFTFSMLMAR